MYCEPIEEWGHFMHCMTFNDFFSYFLYIKYAPCFQDDTSDLERRIYTAKSGNEAESAIQTRDFK